MEHQKGEMPPINESPTLHTKEGKNKMYELYKKWIKEGVPFKEIAVIFDITFKELKQLVFEYEA